MRKILSLIIGLILMYHVGAIAAEKYTPPPVPNAGNVFQKIQDEEKKCKDISPTKNGNCGKDKDKDKDKGEKDDKGKQK